MEKRLQREKEFHNHRFNEGDKFIRKQKIAPFYSIAQHSFDAYKKYIMQKSEKSGQNILEFGCGMGGIAFELARSGSHVIGIDISEEAVKKAEDYKQVHGISDSDLRFMVMNAEELDFAPESFDLIFGSAILHHLDLEKAFYAIKSTLTKDGVAIFLEPLGHNPLINAFRKFTADIRTPDEHPLLIRDIRLARTIFSDIHIDYFHFFTFLAVLFRNYRVFQPMLSFLIQMDHLLFKYLPIARPLAWSTIIKFKK